MTARIIFQMIHCDCTQVRLHGRGCARIKKHTLSQNHQNIIQRSKVQKSTGGHMGRSGRLGTRKGRHSAAEEMWFKHNSMWGRGQAEPRFFCLLRDKKKKKGVLVGLGRLLKAESELFIRWLSLMTHRLRLFQLIYLSLRLQNAVKNGKITSSD